MSVYGIEVDCACCKIILGVLLGGAIVLLALIKFYLSVTCAYCKDNKRMDGKTVIVTGANGGIGKETAKEIAKRGARLIMACRNLETANAAKDDIIKSTGNTNVVVKKLDLSSQKSIRDFAEDIIKTEPKLDVLLHNAGCAVFNKQLSVDDIEMTMATNHFGPFLLTHLLIDLLKRTSKSRIIIVASELYRLSSLNLNKLNPRDAFFPAWNYYVSKYANICFTRELARRLEGTNVTANCLHPGLIDTGIWSAVPVPLSWGMNLIIKCFFKTPIQGAQTSIYLTCSEEVEGVSGKYFMECKESSLSSGAEDMDKAKKLWEKSEKMVNLRDTDPKI